MPVDEKLYSRIKEHVRSISVDRKRGAVQTRDEKGDAHDFTDVSPIALSQSNDTFIATLKKAGNVFLTRPIIQRIDTAMLIEPRDYIAEMERINALDIRVRRDIELIDKIFDDYKKGFTEKPSLFEATLGNGCMFLREHIASSALDLKLITTNEPFKDTRANSTYISATLVGRFGTFYEKHTVIGDGDFDSLHSFITDVREAMGPFSLITEETDLARYTPFEYVDDARRILDRSVSDALIVAKYPERADYSVAGLIKSLHGPLSARVAEIEFIETDKGSVDVELRIGDVKKTFEAKDRLSFCREVINALNEDYEIQKRINPSKDPDLFRIERLVKERYENHEKDIRTDKHPAMHSPGLCRA